MDTHDRVTGRIVKAHGLHGEVIVEIHTDDPESRFAIGSSVILYHNDKKISATVLNAKNHSGRLIISFDISRSRNDADALKGALCLINSADLELPSDPDEFYDWQLEGLHVHDTSGRDIGIVSHVMHLPAGEVLAITTSDDHELLLPFTVQCVPHIDLNLGTLIVNPPEGLWDDN